MALKFNPLTGKLDEYGPVLTGTGTVSAAADGTVALPGIAFASDLNTGIYRPGADQLAISTNGTGRLFVDASGRVGVGTASPAVPLSVTTAASGEALRLTNGTNNERLHFYTGANALVEANNSNLALTAKDAYNIIFSTVNTERIRITSDGKVGLGTSSPSYKLHVDGETFFNKVVSSATGDYTRVNATAIFRGKSGRAVFIGTDNSSVSYVQVGNADIDSGTWPLAINPNGGNVGIGTQSPQTKLEVNNDSTTEIEVARFRSNGNTNNPMIRFVVDESQNVRKIDANGSVLGALAFNQGSNERMRIDSSGRLLVGTSSNRSIASVTSSLLQVETTTNFALSLAQNANTNGAAVLSFGKSRGTAAGGTTVVQSGDDLGSILFAGADGTDVQSRAASIVCSVDGTPDANDMPGRLVFSTTADGASSPTERMRIGSTGQTYWGAAAPSGTSFGTSIARLGINGLFENFRNTDGAGGVATIGGTVGYAVIRGDGDLENTNNSYTGISDIKLKENIVDANSQWDDLKALQVRNYNFKAETGFNTHTQIGLIAQEVELVSPGLVSESPDRDEDGNDLGTVTKSVNYSVLYMKAVKALQEAMERIEVLEAKVNALEGN
jgi:hypothetical protein